MHTAKSKKSKVYAPTGLLKVQPGYRSTVPTYIASSAPDGHVSHSFGDQIFLQPKGIGDDHLPRVASLGGLVSPTAKFQSNHTGTIAAVARDATLISSNRKVMNQKSYTDSSSTAAVRDYSTGRIDSSLISNATIPSKSIGAGAVLAVDARYFNETTANPPGLINTLVSGVAADLDLTYPSLPGLYSTSGAQSYIPDQAVVQTITNTSGVSLHFVGKTYVNVSPPESPPLFLVGNNDGSGAGFYGILSAGGPYSDGGPGLAYIDDQVTGYYIPRSVNALDLSKVCVVSITLQNGILYGFANGVSMGTIAAPTGPLSTGFTLASGGLALSLGHAMLYEAYGYLGYYDMTQFEKDHLYLHNKYLSIEGT